MSLRGTTVGSDETIPGLHVAASAFCEAVSLLTEYTQQRGDCFVAKTAPRNDIIELEFYGC